jgi:thioredoxin-like negative regulator of GroEL
VSDADGVREWGGFIEDFPYDPRGYYSRAAQRFQSEAEHNYVAEVADLKTALEINPRYADAHKLLLRVYVREGDSDQAIAHLDSMRRSQSGLDHSAINQIEAELTASTGRFDRLVALVMASLQESVVDGSSLLAHAASVLLRDHEYDEVVSLCETVTDRLQQATPHLVQLLLGRALTMLSRFDEAQQVLQPLEEDPGLLPREYRITLAGWAEDARDYPVLLNSLTSLPPPRQRFDLARILAVSGADPVIWVSLFNTDGINPTDAVNWVYPADHMLNAVGHIMLAQRREGPLARGLRSRAVQLLRQAFEEGYLNRDRVRRDPNLQPLLTETELQPFFKVE